MTYLPKPLQSYTGNQVLINSDRLVFNAKTDSILLFSDKVIGFSTNGSFHFDTSPEKESKFVINSPNIYLGLQYNNTLPEEPAVLGDELCTNLDDILDLIDSIYSDIAFQISYMSTTPGTPTGPFINNVNLFQKRQREIENIRSNIQDIKSKNIKLV
jgi:hypothetical protein